jgi:hypothetical protein
VVNRLHVLRTRLLPGGAPRDLDADTAAHLLHGVRPRSTGPRALCRVAVELVAWRAIMINGIPHTIAPPRLDPTQTPRRNTTHDPP